MFLRTSLRVTALASLLSFSLGAWAQASEANLSDQDRAKRDASKVFNFIKFHAVRSAKPADKPAEKPSEKVAEKPADKPLETRVAAAPARPASEVQVAALAAQDSGRASPLPGAALQSAAAPQGARTVSMGQESAAPLSAAVEPAAGTASAAPALAALVSNPQPAPAVTPTPEPEPEEETGLQLVEYVEPELPRANNVTTLKGGTVTVRFEVGTDGKVVSAVPRDGAPRRLAQAAARAVQQWRFAPLSSAREAEVDIVFNLE